MPGEKELELILANLAPAADPVEYVFCTFRSGEYGDFAQLNPIASFRESEGLTLVVPRATADTDGVPYDSVFRCITLNVHTSLDAVGVTAVVAGKLAESGISANVIAAYFHDHIFVQREEAERAVTAIHELSAR